MMRRTIDSAGFSGSRRLRITVIGSLLCFGFCAALSAQERPSGDPAANIQDPQSEVLELESDISMDQIKPGAGIKPSVGYGSGTRNVASPAPAASAVSREPSGSRSGIRDNDPRPSYDESDEAFTPVFKDAITDAQIVQMSASLRKLIEENDEFKKKMSDLDSELRSLRGQSRLDSNRMTEISLERDALRKQVESIGSTNSEYEKRLQEIRNELAQKEQEYNLRIIRLQTELADALKASEQAKQAAAVQPVLADPAQVEPQPAADEPVVETKEKAKRSKRAKAAPKDKNRSAPARSDVPQPPVEPPATADARASDNRSISVEVSARSPEDLAHAGRAIDEDLTYMQAARSKLIRDEAKVHYNMGNTYFNLGDYARAAKEYRQAIEFTPEDANAHYNLAFVSGHYLNDPRTAAQHYKKYLFFNPHAEDAEVVRQKIIEYEVWVRGDIDFESSISKDIRQKQNDVNKVAD